MKHGLTQGCLGCRCLGEWNRAQGHSEGCRTRLEAEIAKTEGRVRLTTARDEEEEGPGASAEASAAVPAPPRSGEVQDEPMNAAETLTKCSAEDAGHEADDAGRGGVQPDPDSMADGSMPEARREAEALGADAAPARFQQRACVWIGCRRRVRCDQCQFGMTSVDGAGNVGPARKASRQSQQWRLGRLWRSRTLLTVLKSSETGALDCR